jgi:hypothetical protein
LAVAVAVAVAHHGRCHGVAVVVVLELFNAIMSQLLLVIVLE